MDNVVLGKLLKAMQKMSGKSITVLSDESGLTVDTINNLFYARIQKPGFEGVCSLSEVMGFPVEKLLEYLKNNELEDMEVAQITEFLAEAAEDGAEKKAVSAVSAKKNAGTAKADLASLEEAHEKEIERLRSGYARSVENLREQREESLRQMKESYAGLERTLDSQIALLKEERQKDFQFYEKSLNDAEKRYTDVIGKLEKTVESQRRTIRRCITALILIFVCIIILLTVDKLCSDIGWFRSAAQMLK